ncbi:hypothetical protein RD110_18530 [Rhodoferax koreense]|uniref:Holin of 3TMs, for gene-transfer release n=1 Tax=Rhodoferax koreensis TaxID=1842727 RepID=A0A1P8JYX8_9BURK|nr:hypothetical protein [Rhodoferax koreense]APW38953.1 hypothetical protein RD110_18530 [Rhodoferax koreense]
MGAAFDWRTFVGSLAPVLGAALGGPMAGAAVKVLASAMLGTENASEADVASALTSGQLTGEQIVAIKTAEQQFALQMRTLEIDVLKINQAADDAQLRDVQDARARQIATKDFMPQVIFFVLLALFAAEVAMFYFGKMPSDEYTRALLTRAFGTVEGGMVAALTYFIGSSRGSKASGDAVRKIAEQAGRASE